MKLSPLKRWIPSGFAALIAPLIAAWPQRAQAVNGDWTPVGTATAGTYSWALPTNWTSNPLVPGSTAGDIINLNAAFLAANSFQLNGNRTMGSLTINPNITFASNIVANGTGGYLIFDNGAGTATLNFTSANPTPGINTIFAPIQLRSNLEVSSSIAGGQALRGSITGVGGLTFDSNGVHGPAVTNALGDFVLSGVNSYGGGTTITEARVASGSSWAFGTGAVTVNNGGQIYAVGGGFFNNNITFTGQGWNEPTGLLGAIRMEGTTVLNGTTTLAVSGVTPVRINSHGAATGLFNGQITGTANVEFTNTSTGANTFILNNSTNNWAGTTRIGRGTAALGTSTLQVGNNNTSGVLGANDILIDAGGVLAFNRTDNITVANQIVAGAGGLAQIGLGQTTLTNANILHTGASTVSGFNSRLTLGTGGALTLAATTGNYTLSNFADLQFNTSSNININSSINGARGSFLIQDSANTLTLSGTTDNASNRLLLNSGTVVFAKTGAGTGAIGSPYAQYGLIQNGGTLQLAGGTGTQIFDQTALRLNSGIFDLNGQTEQVGTVTGPGGAGSVVITNNAVAPATITFGGSSIQGGATVGTPYGIFSDNNTPGGSTMLDAPVFGGIIQDGGGGGVVNIGKADTGLQILTGVNTFTGTTTIAAGTLSITGSLPVAGTVSLNAVAANLAGTGSVGNVDIAVAGGSIRPGITGYDNEAPGSTLTMASLTANGGSLVVGVGAATDLIRVTGPATLPVAGPPSLNPLISAPLALGNYTVLTAAGGLTVPTLPTLVGLPTTTRSTYGVAATVTDLQLTVAGAVAQSHAWAAPGTAGTWDANVTSAWTSTDNLFFNLDAVTLGGAAANTAITLNTVVSPAGIIDNSTAGGYTITGTGGIAGFGTLNKSGASTLTLATANTFSGDVNITGGIITAGSAAALGNTAGQTYISGGGSLNINNQNLGTEIINIAGTGVGGNGAIINNNPAGTINATRFVRLTGDATIGGTGRWDVRDGVANGGGFLDLGGFTLTKTGTNQTNLVAVNVTDGNIVVNSGMLGMETSTIIQGTGSLTYNAGSTMQFWGLGNGNVTRPVFLNNASVDGGGGATATINSPITTTGTITLTGLTGASTLTFGGDQTEASVTNLVKNTGNTHIFAGNVNYTGTTSVNQGTLTLAGLNAASSSAVNSVTAPGATTLGTALAPAAGGTGGNLNYGSGGYTTIASVPSSVTINNGTLGINTRISQNFTPAVAFAFNGGTNTLSVIGAEQDTTINLTGATIGDSTQYGNLGINGGTVNVGAGTALNVRSISMAAQGGNVAGANLGILNVTGGNHKLASLYLGDATNGSSIVNMSAGSLTFEQNGNATLQSANTSGAAVGGVSGIRIGHFGNANLPGSILNLSGGMIDASKVTTTVGWDGAGFLNVTGGTLKARTLVVDGNTASPIPTINRVDLSGGGRIEIGHGGMPTVGANTAINSGNGTWAAVESSDWTRGMSLNATGADTTTFDTGTNRVLMTGQLAGFGSLTKDGSGILQLGAPQTALTLTTTAGSALVTNTAGTIVPGMLIFGNPNIPAGSYVASVNSTTTFTLSSGTGVTAASAIASTQILPNLQTGALAVNEGILRLNNALALGDASAVTFASGSTLDVNGFNNTGLIPAINLRPSTITLGGAGQPGMLGGLINISGTTGGVSADNGGAITIASDLTVYTVGRTELGAALGTSTYNNVIAGGTNTLTKNGQGQLVYRGAAGSSLGNIVVNGGQFYSEDVNNNLGPATHSITANRGGMISAFQSGGTTSQSKPVVLNGGGILADVTSTWNGGLTLTANSQIQRSSTNAAVLNFDGALDLGGFTLTRRDRGATTVGASAVTFTNNLSSGNGSLDIQAGNVNIGDNSTFDGTGSMIVRTDALVSIAPSATVSKTIQLYGGSVTDAATSGTRSLTVDSAGSGFLRSSAGGTISLGSLNLLGSPGTATTARNAGMMFGSGTGWQDETTAGPALGAITMSNPAVLGEPGLLNPNMTVSSNPGLTTNNDTTFAVWNGSQVTGMQPTATGIVASTALAFINAATPAPAGPTTIGSFIAENTITLGAATDVLNLSSGGIILREAAAAGWTGAGSITSGRDDGILGLTLTNRFSGSNGLGGADVGTFTVGNITNNLISASPAAFRPVSLVVNGFGNSAGSAQQKYTGGTYMNGGRFEPTTPNALGLGNVWVREGGSILYNGSYGVSNNHSLKGLGINESGGTFGAVRLGGGGGSAVTTGSLSLESGLTRIHTTNTGFILGNVTGPASNAFQRTGSGTIIVYSAATYAGPTHLGIDGVGTPMGTHTVFNLGDGGTASGLGASSSAASNLVFQSGTLNYIGSGASTDRLFTVAPTMTTSASALTIANNGYGNLAFSNPGAVVMDNGSADVTLTLTANNYTANTFTPSLANPAGARLGVTVNGPGSWTLNGSSYNIGGNVALSGGADLIVNTPADLTLPFLSAGSRSYLVKEGTNTLTLGGAGLGTELDNGSGQIIVNAGTVIFDKRGGNGYAGGAVVGAGNGARISALGANGVNVGDGLVLNAGTVRYAPTANLDQMFDSVDVRINGGTLDFNGRSDAFDSLNGTGGRITNGLAGSLSQVGIGSGGSLPSALNFRALATYTGVIEDGAGQIDLIKQGNGVQELTGTNTYSGKTSVLAGLLRISSEANLGANPATFDLSHLILSGGGLESSTNVTIDDVNRGVWLQNGTSPIRPDAGTNLTFATGIAGSGAIEAVGQGTVTLAGSNIYTGATSLYRGTLALDYTGNNTSKLADGAALNLRGGNLVLNGGTHVEVVGSTAIEGGGVNAGASYLSLSGGRTAAINLNGIGRTNATAGALNIIGGTLDLAANGIATTDSTNLNGILTGTAQAGGSGIAYATVGKTNWAVNSTSAADGPINGLATYSNTNALTSHLDPVAGATAVGTGLGATLRFNQAAGSSITGTSLALNQQGILMTPAAGASSIGVTTLTGFATPSVAVTSDLVVHQHSANDLTISSIIANTVSGTFTNTTGLTKSGAGKLILTGANTATGITHINEGTLELQGLGVLGANVAGNAVWVDGTLSLNRAGAYTINNNMGGAATGVFLKRDNTGIATLSGSIGSYAGGVVVSQGTLITTGDAFGNANATNELAANGTVYGTITLGDGGTGPTDDVIYLDGRGAAHTIRKNIVVTNTGSSGVAVIGATTGKTGAFNTIHQGSVQLNRSTTFRADGNDRLTFQGIISGNVGTLTIDAPNVTAVAINTNPGRITLENSNTFVGDVVVNGAILQVGTGVISDPQDQIPDASNVTLSGLSATKQAGLTLSGDSETINNLNGNATSFIQSAASSSAAGMRLTVNGTGTFSGVFHGGNNTGMTLEKAGSGTFTLAGTADNPVGRVLVTSGTLELAKLGTGSGVRAVNTDSVIQGGTLLLGGSGGDQIWDSASLTMYGGTLDLGGTNEAFANIFSNPGVGTITNSAGTASTLTLGGNQASSLLGAVIGNGTGGMGLRKEYNGGAVLTGTNTYSGATTITGGYIQLGSGGTTGSIGNTSGVAVSANAQIVFNRSDNVSFAPVISGAGGLVQNGGGILEIPLGTANPYNGPTVVNSGELKVNGSMLTSATTLNPGTILSGTGSMGPVGSLGGSIRPGNSAGILTTGSVVASAGTSFVYELNGATPGTGYDQLQVAGLVDLGTTSVFTFSASYTPNPALDRFWLIANDGTDPILGQFAGITEGMLTTINGQPFYYTYLADAETNTDSGGNDFALVPEPSATLLVLLSSAGLLRLRRRAAAGEV